MLARGDDDGRLAAEQEVARVVRMEPQRLRGSRRGRGRRRLTGEADGRRGDGGQARTPAEPLARARYFFCARCALSSASFFAR